MDKYQEYISNFKQYKDNIDYEDIYERIIEKAGEKTFFAFNNMKYAFATALILIALITSNYFYQNIYNRNKDLVAYVIGEDINKKSDSKVIDYILNVN